MVSPGEFHRKQVYRNDLEFGSRGGECAGGGSRSKAVKMRFSRELTQVCLVGGTGWGFAIGPGLVWPSFFIRISQALG